MNKYLPYLSATGMALIFGFSFLFSKNALESLDIFQLLFLRFLMALLVMSILIVIKIIRVDYKGKDLKPLIIIAALEPVLYFIMETLGLKLTASSEAGVMMSFVPILTAIFGFFILKEKLNIKQMISIALSVVGVVILVIMSSKIETGGHFKGVLFLFGAVVAASLYNVLSRKASSVFTPWEITYFMMMVGTAFFGMMAIGTGIINANLGNLFQISSSALISLLYLSVVSSLIAFYLYNYSLSKLPAFQSSVFANLISVVSILAGIIFRNEIFEAYKIYGAILIIAGVFGTNYFENDSKAEQKTCQRDISL